MSKLVDNKLLAGIILFVVGVLQLLASQTFTPPTWLPFITLAIGILSVIASSLGQALLGRAVGSRGIDGKLIAGILLFIVSVLELLVKQPFFPPALLSIVTVVIGILSVLASALGQVLLVKLGLRKA